LQLPFTQNPQPTLQKHHIGKRKLLLIVLGLILIISTAVGVFFYLRERSTPDNTPDEDRGNPSVVSVSTEAPSEEIPGPNYNWVGDPQDPKYIRMPSIGVDAYVQQVGVDQNNQIAVPNNIHVVGWFVDSVRPGENGLSIIDGHLDGTSMGGVFRHLVDLAEGDIFEIELGDGTIKQFRVIAVVRVGLGSAEDPLFSQIPTVASQLNLITCGGTYDRATRTYDQRDIVQAEYTGTLE
jgi:sortase (surface protein transpeptidase)